jgi:vitamin B12 transporter
MSRRFEAAPSRSLRARGWACVLALLLCGSGVASGEEPGAASVPAAADDGAAVSDSIATEDEIRVTGIRTQRIVGRPSAFVSVVEMDDYVAEQKDIAELLGEQVGVQVRRFGGPGEAAEVSIRGSTGSQVVVKLDGVRINSALSGSTDVSQLCLGLLESAEITRGGDPLGSGEGAIGGSVDLRTRRPGAVPVNRVEASGGAFGTWETTVLRNARAGALEYGIGYCGFGTEGDYTFARPDIEVATRPPTPRPPIVRVNNESIRHAGNLLLGTDTGEVGHLVFSDYFAYANRGEPGLDSGDDPLGGQNPYASAEEIQNLARIEWSADDLGWAGDQLEASFHHRYQRLEFDDPGVSANDEPVSSLTETHTFGVEANDVWSFDALAAGHELGLLASARRDAAYASEVGNEGRTTVGVALSDDAGWLDDRIHVAPGVRFEWIQDVGAYWLPAIGVVLTPLPWFRIKANWQESLRAPSFDELYLPDKGFIRGNPDLLPERSSNADAGVVLSLAELGPFRDLRFEGGVFQQDIDESIVWVPISPRTIEPNNTGPARVRGFELAFEVAFTRFVRLRTNHTGLQSESLTTGRPLPGRADSESLVRLEIGDPGRWKTVGEMHRTGEIPVSPSGAIMLPSRIVWSASAAINLAGFDALHMPERLREFWIYLTLDNISDVAVRDGLFFPQPGRSGYIGTEIAW